MLCIFVSNRHAKCTDDVPLTVHRLLFLLIIYYCPFSVNVCYFQDKNCASYESGMEKTDIFISINHRSVWILSFVQQKLWLLCSYLCNLEVLDAYFRFLYVCHSIC